MNLIKSKALFMVTLILASIFSISLLAPPTRAQTQLGCCEQTNAGASCVYTDVNNCNQNSRVNFATCEQTSYCSLGSCYIEEEGRCFKNTPQTTCNVQGGTFFEDPECNIPQARLGCCLIGNEAFYTTQARCLIETSKFPSVDMEFDESVASEQACLDQSRSLELGACVKSDGTCEIITREFCSSRQENRNTSVDPNGPRVGFHKGFLCSNQRLGTECARQQNTQCAGEDVYYFDSCGNKENIYNSNKDIAFNNGFILNEDESCSASTNDPNCGNCDYLAGNICGESTSVKPTIGNLICRTTSCLNVFENPSSPNSGGDKSSGESWCLYDGQVGLGRDLVGSRHFRSLCINGEEIIEPCRDFREEICVQASIDSETANTLEAFGIQEGFIEAGCRINRWDECSSLNEIEECGGACSGLEDPNPDTDENELQRACCARQACQNDAFRDCAWIPSGIQQFGFDPQRVIEKNPEVREFFGVCVPTVPPGLKFWGDDVSVLESSSRSEAADLSITGSTPSSTETVCEAASLECTVTWRRGGGTRILGALGVDDKGWSIIKNEHCTRDEWVIAGNNYCKSLGDCGAYFNIVGDATLDGYANTASGERKQGSIFFDGYKLKLSDIADFTTLSTGENDIELISRWAQFGSFNGNALLTIGSFAGIGILNVIPSLGGLSTIYGIPTPALASLGNVITATTANQAALSAGTYTLTAASSFSLGPGTTALVNGVQQIPSTFTAPIGSNLVIQGNGATLTGGTVQTTASSILPTIFSFVVIVLWAYTIYTLVDIFLAEEKEKTYQIGCGFWQAPSGGSDCDECNNDPNRPCSEYTCKSLGQTCVLINQGTTDEACSDISPNDVSSPRITPWRDVITDGFTIEVQPNGYIINEPLPVFEPITIGILTNEPAQCRIDRQPGLDFDTMTAFFGSQLYLFNHSILFELPAELTSEEALRLTNNGQHTIYVKCKDPSGNKNQADYLIRFKLQPTPDLTPPVIEDTSISNNAFIRANTVKTPLSIFVNEPSDCKWSKIDQDYNRMENSFSCQTSGFVTSTQNYGLFECTTELTNLKEGENKFFFRCEDQPGKPTVDRNVNSQSFVFNLIGTKPLILVSSGPEGTFFTGNITLTAETSEGAQDGQAICGYSTQITSFENMIAFDNTDSNLHSQDLQLQANNYDFNLICRDVAGNQVTSTINFRVLVDEFAPNLLHIFDTANNINIELDETATCEFGNESFSFGQGTLFSQNGNIFTAPKQEKLNIVCRDRFENELSFVLFP